MKRTGNPNSPKDTQTKAKSSYYSPHKYKNPPTPALARMNSFSFCICLSRESTTNKCRMNSRRRSSRGLRRANDISQARFSESPTSRHSLIPESFSWSNLCVMSLVVLWVAKERAFKPPLQLFITLDQKVCLIPELRFPIPNLLKERKVMFIPPLDFSLKNHYFQSCQKSAKTGRFGLLQCSYKKESNERKKTDSLYFGNLEVPRSD